MLSRVIARESKLGYVQDGLCEVVHIKACDIGELLCCLERSYARYRT